MKTFVAMLCVMGALVACTDSAESAKPVSDSTLSEQNREAGLKKLQEPYKGEIPPVTRKNLNVFPEK